MNARTIVKEDLIEWSQAAGRILMKRFGRIRRVTCKENHCNVVTLADMAAEKYLLARIREKYPSHNVVAEETGICNRGSEFTWIIDPLDGTSNFTAGLPWFGVMLTVARCGQPIVAVAYMPVSETLYVAERGKGAFRNGRRLRVSTEVNLKNALCAFALDATSNPREGQRNHELLGRLVSRVRNVRMTNCLVDFCSTVDGRLGACLNQMARIWDIAPFILMIPEAGGVFTDQTGKQIAVHLDENLATRDYAVVGGNPHLHRQVLAIIRSQAHRT
jgi:myo-inositol-1(or 4)-monophosphatase